LFVVHKHSKLRATLILLGFRSSVILSECLTTATTSQPASHSSRDVAVQLITAIAGMQQQQGAPADFTLRLKIASATDFFSRAQLLQQTQIET